MERDPLEVDPETMRRLGYQVVDWLVERTEGRPEERVLRQASAARWPAACRAPTSLGPGPRRHPPRARARTCCRSAAGSTTRATSPTSRARGPGPARSGTSSRAPATSTCGNWMESAGPSQARAWCSTGSGSGSATRPEPAGVLVSGGSAANLTALACAREALVGAMTDDARRLLLRPGATRRWPGPPGRSASGPSRCACCPADEQLPDAPGHAGAAIDADLAPAAGRCWCRPSPGRPTPGRSTRSPSWPRSAPSTASGSTSTPRTAAFAVLTERGRGRSPGSSWPTRSRSTRTSGSTSRSSAVRCWCATATLLEARPSRSRPTTWQDTRRAATRGQLRRPRPAAHPRAAARSSCGCRCSTSGSPRSAAAIERSWTWPSSRRVTSGPELELMTPATLGIVCFRRRPAGHDAEAELRAECRPGGGAGEAGTAWCPPPGSRGRYAIRLCVLNHSTSTSDVGRVIDWLETASFPAWPRGSPAEGPPVEETRTADVGAGWPCTGPGRLDRLRTYRLLADVEEGRLGWVATVGRPRAVAAGETVVRQWDVDRDFYLVLEGRADGSARDGCGDDGGRGLLRRAGGDGLGSDLRLPAVGHGPGKTDLELLVLSDTELAELMGAAPAVDRRIRVAAGERASRL